MNLIKFALVASTLLGIARSASAQADTGPGARSFGLGETGLGFLDINAVYTNPAGLNGVTQFSLLASASRPFGVPELTRSQIAAAIPISSSDFLFGTIARKGKSNYHQSRISAGYGRKIANSLSIAVEFEAIMLRIRGYGNDFAMGYGISLQHRPFDQLLIGVHLRNPIPIYSEDRLVPKTTISAGFSYIVSELVEVNLEVFKDTQFKLRIKSGIEYRIHPVFVLRIGASSNPTQLHFGFGWRVKKGIVIDFSVGYQALLGVTPVIGVGYLGI